MGARPKCATEKDTTMRAIEKDAMDRKQWRRPVRGVKHKETTRGKYVTTEVGRRRERS